LGQPKERQKAALASPQRRWRIDKPDSDVNLPLGIVGIVPIVLIDTDFSFFFDHKAASVFGMF
jgi:hypothetical protein